MTTSRAVVARAHAKINVSLRVLGVRTDGYHELRTVLQSLALHDTITCIPIKGPFRLHCSAADVPRDSSNLIWRAASALSQVARGTGEPANVAVVLQKRIPVGAGLGGGSSDAAAALVALARLWRLRSDNPELRKLAVELGADVPYFMTGGTALGLGRGDQIYPLADSPPRWVVLLTPPFAVSTQDAYAWFDRDGSRRRRRPPAAAAPLIGPSSSTGVENDLERAVARRHPAILDMKVALERRGALGASMSGSGSTVFGLFPTRQLGATACRALNRFGWRAQLTRTLTRAGYRDRARPKAGTGRLPRPAFIG